MLRNLFIGLATLCSILLSTCTLVGQGDIIFYVNDFEDQSGWIKSFDVIDQFGSWKVVDGTLVYNSQEPAKASLHVGVDISAINLTSDKILVSLQSGLKEISPDQHWGIGLRRSEDSEPILFLISANNRWGLYKGFGKKSLLEGKIKYAGPLTATTMEIKLSKSKHRFDFIVRDSEGKIIVQQNIVEYYDLTNSDGLDAFIYAESGKASISSSIWFDDFQISQK